MRSRIPSLLRRLSSVVDAHPPIARIAILTLLLILPLGCGGGGSQVTDPDPEPTVDPANIVVTITAFDGPVAGIAATLHNPGGETARGDRKTDGHGVVRFEGVEPGSYEVRIDPLPGFTVPEGQEPRKSANAPSGGSAEVVFDLTFSAPLTDIDGNVYRTVPIGSQVWMADNLKVARFRNGDAIPEISDDDEWQAAWEVEGRPAWTYYDNSVVNGARFGKLYSRVVIDDARALCPEGWHVPTDEEWKALETVLGMTQSQADGSGWRGDIAGALRSVRTAPDPSPRWEQPNVAATDETGFSALPGGYRVGVPNYEEQVMNDFMQLGAEASFWAAGGGGRALWPDRNQVFRGGRDSTEGFAFSVRCIEE